MRCGAGAGAGAEGRAGEWATCVGRCCSGSMCGGQDAGTAAPAAPVGRGRAGRAPVWCHRVVPPCGATAQQHSAGAAPGSTWAWCLHPWPQRCAGARRRSAASGRGPGGGRGWAGQAAAAASVATRAAHRRPTARAKPCPPGTSHRGPACLQVAWVAWHARQSARLRRAPGTTTGTSNRRGTTDATDQQPGPQGGPLSHRRSRSACRAGRWRSAGSPPGARWPCLLS